MGEASHSTLKNKGCRPTHQDWWARVMASREKNQRIDIWKVGSNTSIMEKSIGFQRLKRSRWGRWPSIDERFPRKEIYGIIMMALQCHKSKLLWPLKRLNSQPIIRHPLMASSLLIVPFKSWIHVDPRGWEFIEIDELDL